ncbi:hypothetical protein [Aureivirga sp. CE67]|uniref:hypothetical protein n=1 Tax=Aureivirga sp. CE67 TaxID=1788983 RepID=UPI0018C9493D|nr:hypothetical protein [Aureivirga sp. CE67]
MNVIKEFLKSFFNAEAVAKDAMLIPDLKSLTDKVNILNEFCIKELDNAFVAKMDNLLPDGFYKRAMGSKKFQPRHLFKISHYINDKYGDLYLAYVSEPNTDSKYDLEYFDCFFITKINNEYKIIRDFFVHKDRDMGTINWNPHHGDRDIDFDTVGEYISSERYLEPSECEFSMKDYLADK